MKEHTTVYRYHPTNRYKHDSKAHTHMGKRQQLGGNASRRFDERVTCLICNKSYLALNVHVKVHGIKIKEYRAKFRVTKNDTMSKDLIEKKRIISTNNYKKNGVDLYKITHSKQAIESRKKYWETGGREDYAKRMNWMNKRRWDSYSPERRKEVLSHATNYHKKEWEVNDAVRFNCKTCGIEMRYSIRKNTQGNLYHVKRIKKYCDQCRKTALKGIPKTREHVLNQKKTLKIKWNIPDDYDRRLYKLEMAKYRRIITNI